ncbi:unnamed protein product [Urochloa humidicola]
MWAAKAAKFGYRWKIGNEFYLEESGRSTDESSGYGTKLANLVPPRQERCDVTGHQKLKGICKQTRENHLGSGRLNQGLISFLVDHPNGWKWCEVPSNLKIWMNQAGTSGKSGILFPEEEEPAATNADDLIFKGGDFTKLHQL